MDKHLIPPPNDLNSAKNSQVHPAGAKNKRSAVRYDLCAPVVFTWVDGTGDVQERRGYTRDISPKGAYVVASACPPQGTSLEMTIYLSVASENSRDIRIEAQACVLRVELEIKGQHPGFSVRNHWIRYARVE